MHSICPGRQRQGRRLGRRNIHQQFRPQVIDFRRYFPGERLKGGFTQILLPQLDKIYAAGRPLLRKAEKWPRGP